MFYQLVWDKRYYFQTSTPDIQAASIIVKNKLTNYGSNACLIYAQKTGRFLPEYYFLKHGIERRPDLIISLDKIKNNNNIIDELLRGSIDQKKCGKLILFLDHINKRTISSFSNLVAHLENSEDLLLINNIELNRVLLQIYQHKNDTNIEPQIKERTILRH